MSHWARKNATNAIGAMGTVGVIIVYGVGKWATGAPTSTDDRATLSKRRGSAWVYTDFLSAWLKQSDAAAAILGGAIKESSERLYGLNIGISQKPYSDQPDTSTR